METGPPEDRSTNRVNAPTGIRIPFSKRRWRYQRDGRDFGPFSGENLIAEIRQGALDPTKQVYEEWSQASFRLGDVPEFARVLEEVRRENERAQLEKDTNLAEEEVRAGKTRRFVQGLGTLALLLLGVYGLSIFAFSDPSFPPSQMHLSFFSAPTMAALPKLTLEPAQMPESVVSTAPLTDSKKRLRKQKKKTNRRSSSSNGSNLVSTSGPGLMIFGVPSASSLSFEEEDFGGATQQFDVEKASIKVAGPLRRCMMQEAAVSAEFRGGTVTFWVASKGKVTGARLKGAGMVSSQLVSCLKNSLTRVTFSRFTGGHQKVRIPVRVSSR